MLIIKFFRPDTGTEGSGSFKEDTNQLAEQLNQAGDKAEQTANEAPNAEVKDLLQGIGESLNTLVEEVRSLKSLPSSAPVEEATTEAETATTAANPPVDVPPPTKMQTVRRGLRKRVINA